MTTSLTDAANAVRFLALDAVEAAQSGHPGMPMGMADVATVLFSQFLKVSPADPSWFNRDRFVLSAGHGSMLLYAVYHLLGYPELSLDSLKHFRQLYSATPGHPEHGHTAGVDVTTGPLGQGLAHAVGMALSESMLHARFADVVDHHTYVIVGDGCLMEGISQEAISLAGHLRLKKLIVLWDDNHITIDGSTDLSTSDDMLMRFTASGWNTTSVDAYDHHAIANALTSAKSSDRPVFIACRSIIGYGAPHKQGSSSVHGSPLGTEEALATRKALGWSHPPFIIPDDIQTFWRGIGQKNDLLALAWHEKLLGSVHAQEFQTLTKRVPPAPNSPAFVQFAQDILQKRPIMATRDASHSILDMLFTLYPNLIGGSADLSASVKSHPKSVPVIGADNFLGRYINYGIREHGMAAVMGGISLHGAFHPFGGTFLAFADYMRPAMRLASIMGLPITYVLSHDSIGVGEDGPTHQPVETLTSLRIFPRMDVFRPMDAIETLECWSLALASTDTPCVLALSRQGLPTLRTDYDPATNRSAMGGYTLLDTPDPVCCILASGSEVSLAVSVQERLAALGFPTRVITVPCLDILARQDTAYLQRLLPLGSLRCVIEAGVRQSWDFLLDPSSLFFGVETFGVSAPIHDVFNHFHLNPDAIFNRIAPILRGRHG